MGELRTADGRYVAVEQGDGNFVVYDTGLNPRAWTPLWDRWSHEAARAPSLPGPLPPDPPPVGPPVVPGTGLVLSCADTSVRPRLTPDFVPRSRGPFQFPFPYATTGIKLTCDLDGAIEPTGYAYWNAINAHRHDPILRVVVGRGTAPALLIEVDKATYNVTGRPLPFAGTGEGWYWSKRDPTMLYVQGQGTLVRYDVQTQETTVVWDVEQHMPGCYLWQCHSSWNDTVHSGTVRHARTYEQLGAAVWHEDRDLFRWFPKRGAYDECQVDKSGQWLMVKEDDANRIIALANGATERMVENAAGAVGHSDCGAGYVVGENDMHPKPGAFVRREWATDEVRLVYFMSDWANMTRHVSHCNAPQPQVLISCAHRLDLPRANELVMVPLDGSLMCRVVAPTMVDLDAPGGGDDYRKTPKANLCPHGEWAMWTSNHGSERLDAFLVKL